MSYLVLLPYIWRNIVNWIATVAVGLVAMVGLGWYFGTPYTLQSQHGTLFKIEPDVQFSDLYTCDYDGIQGRVEVSRAHEGDCPHFILFRWSSTCVDNKDQVQPRVRQLLCPTVHRTD